LLRDDRTRVTSENTVFYTIQRWWDRQQQVPQGLLQQLLETVRMQVSLAEPSQVER
jgi:hypothetical protein